MRAAIFALLLTCIGCASAYKNLKQPEPCEEFESIEVEVPRQATKRHFGSLPSLLPRYASIGFFPEVQREIIAQSQPSAGVSQTVTSSGNSYSCTNPSASCLFQTSTSATTMTATVPAFEFVATATPAANDRLFAIGYGATPTRVWSVDVEGDMTAVGGISSTTASHSGTITSTVATGGHALDIESGARIYFDGASGTHYMALAGNLITLTGAGLYASSFNIGTGANIEMGSASSFIFNGAGAVLINDTDGTKIGNGTGTDADGALSTGTVTIGLTGSAITTHTTTTLTDLDIGAAAAGCAVVTGSVTGAALGDTVTVAPFQDDGAWDTGTLTVFVESSGTVKLVYCAVIGGDPAATNDYRIDLWKH